jgi:hypothetical protein
MTEVRYAYPPGVKGALLVATSGADSIVVPYDYAISTEDNLRNAAHLLVDSLNHPVY